MRLLVVLVHSLLLASSVHAQNTNASAARLSFEVASIRLSAPPTGGPMIVRGGLPQRGGGWIATNATLDDIIRATYPRHDIPDQLIGGPALVRSDRFDITAKGPDAASQEQLIDMAQSLLADRFRLRLHTDTREVPGYALVFGREDRRPGPGMKSPAVDCQAVRAAARTGNPAEPAVRAACSVMTRSEGSTTILTAGGLSLSGLANILAPYIGAQVVDSTGLSELFDISLQFSPTLAAQGDSAARSIDPPAIFTAIQEQLGLKLERTRVPTEVMVIDSVEKPTAD